MIPSKVHLFEFRSSLDSTYPDIDSIDDSEQAFRGLQKSRKIKSSTLVLSLVIAAQLVIILIQVFKATHVHQQATLQKSFSPNGLSFKRDIERRGSVITRYMSENETEAAAAWDSIEAGHGLVAIDPQWAAARDLPPSFQHPLNPSKVIYIVEAYHAIHCLKVIRQHYMDLAGGTKSDWSKEHDMHCFDTLRQHIMCMADDTLLYSRGHRDAGVNQTRMCRDWDALRAWATERTACYHDYVPPAGETRWGKCDGGQDGLPVNSLLE